jgi:iron complex outermembrane recepter protein
MNKSQLLSRCANMGLALSMVSISTQVLAQATPATDIGLEEIIVTAQKRAENLQNVPAAISAIAGEDLQARGIANTTDLMGSLPNLQVTSAYSTTQPNFSLRGISVANEFSASTASPVGVYVDEVYQSFRASHGQQLYDLERVEVLRGPQGTLYGRNTTGGAINFITRKPDLDGAMGNVTLGFGSYKTITGQAAVEGTLVPGIFGVRISGTFGTGDGYTFNPTLNNDYGNTNSVAGRISARWKPSDTVDINLKVFGARNNPRQDLPYGIGYLAGRTDAGGYSRFVPRPELGGRIIKQNEVQADSAGNYFTSSYGAGLTAQFEVSDALTLTSITGYDYGKYKLSPFDCDGSPTNVCAIRYQSNSSNFNQDLRLTFDSDRLKLIGGVYYGVDTIKTENEPDFFRFLTGAIGLPGNYSNIPIAVGQSLGIIPAFSLNGAAPNGGNPLNIVGGVPTNFANLAQPGACAAVPNPAAPNGYFDARTLIAFNVDVATTNTPAFPGPNVLACLGAGAPLYGPILANQKFTLQRPSKAIYGEAKYSVTDDLGITIGLRYTWDDVKYKDGRTILFRADRVTPLASLVPYSFPYNPNLPAVNQTTSTGRLTGRVVLDYKFADDILGYASYSRGYRSGTYNGLAYQDVSQVYFVDPEKVNAYEVGLKTRFADNRVQLNLAGFYYDYSNQQIAQIIGATSFLRNASGRVYGAEAELAVQATQALRLNAALGLLDTKYSGNVINSADPRSLTLNINGNPFPNAPKVNFSAGFDWTAYENGESKLVLRGEAQYQGKYYFDPFKDYGQNPCDQPRTGTRVLQATPELACGNPAYWLINGRVTYDYNETFGVSIWGKNITNKFYYVYGLNLNAFFEDYLTRGVPRTFGVEVSAKF